MKPPIVEAHKTYRAWDDGRLEEVDPRIRPDAVVCRRVVDYAPAPIPPGLGRATCARCGAAITFDPTGEFQDCPKVCMQCEGIAPLPIEWRA